MLPTSVLVLVLLPVFISPTTATTPQVPLIHQHNAKTSPITLYLRHLHAVTNTSRVIFTDVPQAPLKVSSFQNVSENPFAAYTLSTSMQITHRPSSFAAHANARRLSAGLAPRSEFVEELVWDEEKVVGPDVTSRETLLTLAKMTSNAYAGDPSYSEWYDLDGGWNGSYPFGWEEDADGFRGHVFTNTDNTTVIISIKGTSPSLIGDGPTIVKDKLNNNLLFSCCCAKVGFSWTPVCGCHSGGWKCDRNCLETSLIEESLFYPIGTNLYNNVTYMYPDANIWIIGHSLGGSLASLLGVTFGAPVVAFEAPGEKMAAGRLHLPSPPSTQHISHVYHTADPVAMGTCNGVSSACAFAGYAMESRCHLGNAIVYDTVSKLNWSVSFTTHRIKVVIDGVLANDWDAESVDPEGRRSGGRAVPIAKPEEDCVVRHSAIYRVCS
ncbi:alpha/beta-hydrolase [Ramaria rubella]|nr:alpha/beta-hydrolase [Ramaria rubella]